MSPIGATAAATQPSTRCIQHSSKPFKKLEVRGLGANPKAKRALAIQEFYKQLQMICAVGQYVMLSPLSGKNNNTYAECQYTYKWDFDRIINLLISLGEAFLMNFKILILC